MSELKLCVLEKIKEMPVEEARAVEIFLAGMQAHKTIEAVKETKSSEHKSSA